MADTLGNLPLFLGFYFLKLIFINYQKGKVFNINNAIYYKYLGYLFFLEAFITKPLSEGLFILAATFNNPTGHRFFQIAFGSVNLGNIFIGALVIIISWIMAEASKMDDEQKLII
ncbi:MAG: hypothetical protein JWM09_364 [Francisellaceae bacterium]|nr:hypothetical protein [Francisellaceae bacterium]